MGQGERKSVADVVALDEARQRRQPEIDSDLTTAGGMLRAAREALGLGQADIARRTNIKEQHVVAMEAMDIAALPGQPYTMGFVRAYAREVELPEEALMERFRQQAGYERRELAPGIEPAKRSQDPEGGRELSVVALILVLGLVMWTSWQLLIKNAPEDPAESTRFAFSKDDQEVAVGMPGEADPAAARQATPTGSGENIDSAATETVTGEPIVEERAPAADEPSLDGPASAPPAQERTEATTPGQPEPAATQSTPDAQETQTEPAASLPRPEPVASELELIARAEPTYPPLCGASAEDLETVTVAFAVGADGRTTSPRITRSTNPCFNGAALAALSRWQYDPDTVTPQNSRGLTTRFAFDRP